jgi:hypothetical protein
MGTQCLGVYLGHPVSGGSQIRRPDPPGWGLGVGLTAPPCKDPVVRESKEGYGPYGMPMMMMFHKERLITSGFVTNVLLLFHT